MFQMISPICCVVISIFNIKEITVNLTTLFIKMCATKLSDNILFKRTTGVIECRLYNFVPISRKYVAPSHIKQLHGDGFVA